MADLRKLVLLLILLASESAGAAPTWTGINPRRDNGLASCQTVLSGFSRRPASPGVRRCVIFDVDNTLVDTRKRTLAAGRKIGLRNVPLKHVGYNALETAVNLGLGKRTTRRFDRCWSTFFWRPYNLNHDGRIEPTIKLAKQAGNTTYRSRTRSYDGIGSGGDVPADTEKIEVFYLTGRINRLKSKTIAQLRKLGLPNADAAHVICKPSIATKTEQFKREEVSKLLHQRYEIGWFMSDSRSDIASVQTVLPARRCVLVGFPVGPADQPAIHPITPVLRVNQ